jgi:drug/metabolite transporter (DMT)-like permease
LLYLSISDPCRRTFHEAELAFDRLTCADWSNLGADIPADQDRCNWWLSKFRDHILEFVHRSDNSGHYRRNTWIRIANEFCAVGRYIFVALFGTILPSAASYTAAEHLPAGVISVCLSLGPLFSLPLAVILSLDRATWMRVLGLILGLVGVLLITLPDTSLPDPTKAVFIPLALLAVLAYAIEAVGLGRMGRAGLDPIQLLLGASIVSSAITFPIAILTHTFILPTLPFGRSEAAVVLSGLANAGAYVGFVWLIGRGGPVFAAQVDYPVTGFGVIWSMLLLGETYSIWIWSALIVIFSGLFLTQPRLGDDDEQTSLAKIPADAK